MTESEPVEVGEAVAVLHMEGVEVEDTEGEEVMEEEEEGDRVGDTLRERVTVWVTEGVEEEDRVVESVKALEAV